MHVEVPLSNGGVMLVDAEDLPLVEGYGWYVGAGGYAITYLGDYKYDYAHLMILPRREGLLVDHANMNTLDNRRANLRYATKAQNVQNGSTRADNTSGYRGVSWEASSKRWVSYVNANGVRHRPAPANCPTVAALRRDAQARKLHGEFFRSSFEDRRRAIVQ